jgi:hypothetical protein
MPSSNFRSEGPKTCFWPSEDGFVLRISVAPAASELSKELLERPGFLLLGCFGGFEDRRVRRDSVADVAEDFFRGC